MSVAVDSKSLAKLVKSAIPDAIRNDQVTFACIGTDRSTGDSLGPLVGTYLKRMGYPNVIGTLEDPLHAMNMENRLKGLKSPVVAIDACLGLSSSVGSYKAEAGPLKPGAGVGKDLPGVGDYHITGIVNVGGFMEYFVLQNTRLSLVMNMAETIANTIKSMFLTGLQEVAVSSDNDLIITEADIQRAATIGVTDKMLRSRVKNGGWDKERAITTPPNAPKHVGNPWVKVAKENGISESAFKERVKRGWTSQKAATTPTGRSKPK